MTLITTFFTSGSTPATGLTPSIKIRNVTTTTLVETGTMSEVGDGWYKYDFSGFNAATSYAVRCDGGATLTLPERYTWVGNDADIQSTVWDTPAIDHITTGTMGHLQNSIHQISQSVSFIEMIEGGTWRIESDQMVFYTSGSMIEVARFDLQDIVGTPIDPSSQNPFRRVRV